MSLVLHIELSSTVLGDTATTISSDAANDVLTMLKPHRPKNNSTNSWNCADHFPWVPPAIDIQNSTNIVEAVIAARLNGEKLKGDILLPRSTTTPTTTTTTTITSLEKRMRSYTDGVLVPYMLVNSTVPVIKQELVSRGALLCTLRIDSALMDFLNTRDIEMCLPVSAALSPAAISRVAAIVGYTQDHWIVEPALGCGCLHIGMDDDSRISTHKLFGFLSRQQKQKQTSRDENAPDNVPVYMMCTSKKVKTKIKPKTVLTLNHGASKGTNDIRVSTSSSAHVKLPLRLKHMFATRVGKHVDVTYFFDMLFVVMVFICATLVFSALFSKKRNLL